MRFWKKGYTENKGFTLVEILVAMAVASIVMTIVYVIYASYSASYTAQEVSAELQQNLRAGMDFMMREIRMAGYEPVNGSDDFGIEVASETKIRFTRDTDDDGVIDDDQSERITYEYDNGTGKLVRILDEGLGTPGLVILENVAEFSFVYLNEAQNNLGSPVAAADLDNIRGVTITMRLEEPAGRRKSISRTISQFVVCRNLGL